LINPDKLSVGQCYFFVNFSQRDPKLSVPNIETLIYVGKNLVGAGKEEAGDEWFFQDPESYLEHGSYLQLPEGIERNVTIVHENSLAVIYDIEGLIACLEKVKQGILAKTGI
jgi:hypothetical protein